MRGIIIILHYNNSNNTCNAAVAVADGSKAAVAAVFSVFGGYMKLTDGLSVQNGHLFIADSDACALAQKYGTPLYVMNYDLIRARCRELRKAMDKYCPGGRIMFASKAFMNEAMYITRGWGLMLFPAGSCIRRCAREYPATSLSFTATTRPHRKLSLH